MTRLSPVQPVAVRLADREAFIPERQNLAGAQTFSRLPFFANDCR